MNIRLADVHFRLGPELNGALMTPEEFDAIDYDDCEEGWRYELINGVLVVNPPPLDAQVGPNEHLGVLLYLYSQEHPQGNALDLTLPERYVRTPGSRRIVDRAIWAGLGRKPRTRVDVPAIAVEFVSEGKRNILRDYEVKRREYLQAGVIEYGVIDRFRRTLTVFRRKRPQKKVIHEDDTYHTPLLPGFELPLAEILKVADRLEE
jgi:Uma2 family endonuclease